MTFIIDRDVPVPADTRRGPGRPVKYPFGVMGVGDSIFVAGAASGTVSSCTRHYRPKRFTCRTVTENGVKGVRIWRVS